MWRGNYLRGCQLNYPDDLQGPWRGQITGRLTEARLQSWLNTGYNAQAEK